MKTINGIKFNIFSDLMLDCFSGYDYAVASCHIKNFGFIIVDEYDCPIDNEDDLEEIFEEYMCN